MGQLQKATRNNTRNTYKEFNVRLNLLSAFAGATTDRYKCTLAPATGDELPTAAVANCWSRYEIANYAVAKCDFLTLHTAIDCGIQRFMQYRQTVSHMH